MQKLRQHMVMVGTLIGAHGLCLVLASIGCNSGPESGDGQGSGWVRYAALDEGPKPPPDVGLLDTQGLSLAGAEGTVSYDFITHAFTGKVENTTTATLRRVRVQVHLSNGITLGPTTPVDLAAGQVVTVTVPASSHPFTHWSAYLEVD